MAMRIMVAISSRIKAVGANAALKMPGDSHGDSLELHLRTGCRRGQGVAAFRTSDVNAQAQGTAYDKTRIRPWLAGRLQGRHAAGPGGTRSIRASRLRQH